MTPAAGPRVLFVTHNVPRYPGDIAGAFILRLAVALQDAGARVDVLAPGATGLSNHDDIEGVPITRVRYAADRRMTLAYTGGMAEAVREGWQGKLALAGLLWRMRQATRHAIVDAKRAGDPFTVVHAHWWFPSGLSLWRALDRRATPLVITMHGSDVRLAEHTPAAHPVMRAVLAQAAQTTAVSSWLADTAHRIAPDAPITIAPMPVDDRLFRQIQMGSPTPAPELLFVGRLNEQKGVADLLQALAHPLLKGIPLHVVGDGPDREALQARASALGLTAQVTWHGALAPSALAPLYRSAALVVVPSRNEGLGLVAVEAQLCGTPVVAYAEGGLLDVVRPEHGGTLVTPGDTQALADAIDRLVNDPDGRRRNGVSAQAFMQARFTPAAVAHTYLGVYERALTAGAGRP